MRIHLLRVSLLGCLLLPASTLAAPAVLDQSHEASTASVGTFSGVTRAQTFTAGLDGRLVRVDLVLGRAESAPHVDMQLDLRATALDGTPEAVAVAVATPVSTSVVSNASAWVSFEFPGDGVAIAAGEVLAIGFAVPLTFPDSVSWIGSVGSDGYTAGESYIDNTGSFVPQGGGFDGSFRTWVETPEPGALASAAAAAGALAALARGRRGRTNA
jgi:hypothetical protein